MGVTSASEHISDTMTPTGEARGATFMTVGQRKMDESQTEGLEESPSLSKSQIRMERILGATLNIDGGRTTMSVGGEWRDDRAIYRPAPTRANRQLTHSMYQHAVDGMGSG